MQTDATLFTNNCQHCWDILHSFAHAQLMFDRFQTLRNNFQQHPTTCKFRVCKQMNHLTSNNLGVVVKQCYICLLIVWHINNPSVSVSYTLHQILRENLRNKSHSWPFPYGGERTFCNKRVLLIKLHKSCSAQHSSKNWWMAFLKICMLTCSVQSERKWCPIAHG